MKDEALLAGPTTPGTPYNVEWLLLGADGKPRAGVRVPSLSTPEWACAFYPPDAKAPALSLHVWRPKRVGIGEPCAIISSNACWAPGEPFVTPKPGGIGQPRSMVVARQVRGLWRIASGSGPGFTKIGVATLYGNVRDPGEVSGWEIFLHPPDGDSWDLVDCTAARMPVAAWNTRTGEILTRENALLDWFEYRLDRGDGPIFRYPHFLREPAFDPDAWAVKAHDQYHGARAFMRALGLWRKHRDPVARALILAYAEDMRVAWTLGGKEPDGGSTWEPFSLRRRLLAAERAPHRGGDIARGVAWSLRLGVAALECDPSNRAQWERWVESMLRYVQLVQLPSGACYMATFGYGLDQDEPVLVFGLDKRKNWAPAWQQDFLTVACWEAQKQLPRVRPVARDIVLNAARIRGPRTPIVAGEDGSEPDVPRYVVVGIDGVPLDEIREGVGNARPYYKSSAQACIDEARQ